MNNENDIIREGVKVSMKQAIDKIVAMKGVSGAIIYPQKIEIYVINAKTKKNIEKIVKELLEDLGEYEILIPN